MIGLLLTVSVANSDETLSIKQVCIGLGCLSKIPAVYLVGIRPNWSRSRTYNAQVLLGRPKAFHLGRARTSRPQTENFRLDNQEDHQR